MAGSYNHIVNDDGSLASNEVVNGMLENGGDVYEAVEEMYGMIWLLAEAMSRRNGVPAAVNVEFARKAYKDGLAAAPQSKESDG